MAQLSLLKGSTSQTVNLFIQDSASTAGAGKTGLAYNTAGLSAYYCRPGAAAAAVTLAAQTATGAWSSGGFAEVSSANMPGWYRLDLPNAVVAAGANSADLHVAGTGTVPLPVKIELTAVDNQSASFGLSLAKTTNITGFNDIAATAVVSNGAIATNGSGKVSGVVLADTVTAYTGNTPQTGDAFARIGSNGAGLTGITGATLTSAYDPAKTAAQASALGTLATAVGTPAQAAQIPANFTTATFASSGVFATAALANAPTGGGGGSVTVAGYAAGQDPATLTWAASTRSLTDKAGFALATAPPTTSAITTAVVAGMSSAPVGSVANLAGISLSGGTVSASPSPTGTTFTATGNLNATAGGYTTAPMAVIWQTGANAGFKYPISGHAVSGSNHAFTVASAMANTPAASDTFVIG